MHLSLFQLAGTDDLQSIPVLEARILENEARVKESLALLGESAIELIGMITEDIVAYAEEVNADNGRLTLSGEIVVAVFSLIAIVLSLVMGLSVTRSITRPLLGAVDTLAQISQGKLCVEVDEASLERTDETGQMMRAMLDMVRTLNDSLLAVASAEEAVRATSLTLNERVSQTVHEIELITGNIREANGLSSRQSEAVAQSSRTVAGILERLRSLGDLITDQSASVTESSASIEEMTGNNKSIAENVEKMTRVFQSLEASSGAGRQSMEETVSIIRETADQSDKLQQANAVINNIAAQTNLLAMNAAIEAAHAGDLGRGFAVVADEIRSLAEKSARQSRAISQDIKTIRASIQKVSESSGLTERAFAEIYSLIKALGEHEQHIRQATSEQVEGSQHILESTTRINSITSEVRDSSAIMVESSTSVAEDLGTLNSATEALSARVGDISSHTDSIDQLVNDLEHISHESTGLAAVLRDKLSRFTYRRNE